MKTTTKMKQTILTIGLPVMMVLAFSLTANSQDTKKETAKQAKVVVKMKSDGKSMNIDTTFNLSNPKDEEAFEKYMKNVEENMGEMEEKMKTMNLTVEIPDFDDSIPLDSIHKKIIRIGKGGKGMEYCFKNCPEAFEYKFDMPCDIEKMMPPGCCEEMPRMHMGRGAPHHRMKMMDEEQTLSDLLGDIPMSRVKSYKIQDKKNGKRIIIDVEDGPINEIDKDVIIIRK